MGEKCPWICFYPIKYPYALYSFYSWSSHLLMGRVSKINDELWCWSHWRNTCTDRGESFEQTNSSKSSSIFYLGCWNILINAFSCSNKKTFWQYLRQRSYWSYSGFSQSNLHSSWKLSIRSHCKRDRSMDIAKSCLWRKRSRPSYCYF